MSAVNVMVYAWVFSHTSSCLAATVLCAALPRSEWPPLDCIRGSIPEAMPAPNAPRTPTVRPARGLNPTGAVPAPTGSSMTIARPSSPSPEVIRATGIGRPPIGRPPAQARLMARRAAEVIAVRNLALKLRIAPGSPVRGFRYLPPDYRPDGTVAVTVEWCVEPGH